MSDWFKYDGRDDDSESDAQIDTHEKAALAAIQALFDAGDIVGAFDGKLDGLNKASEDAQKRLTDATNQLNAYNLVLADSTAGYHDVTDLLNELADAQERATKQLEEYNEQIEKQVDSYEDLLTKEVELRQNIFDIGQAIIELRLDANAKETDLRIEQTQKIADLESEAGERRNEIIAAGLEAAAKINRDYLRASGNAIGNRDADSLRQASILAQDKLTDEQKAQTKTLAQLGVNLNKQETAVTTSTNKQTRQIETALIQQTEIKRRHLQQDEVDLRNTIAAQIGVAINGSSGLYRIHQGMCHTRRDGE